MCQPSLPPVDCHNPQDTRNERVSSVLPRGEHGESVRNLLNPLEFRGHSVENPWEIRGPMTDYQWIEGQPLPNRHILKVHPKDVKCWVV